MTSYHFNKGRNIFDVAEGTWRITHGLTTIEGKYDPNEPVTDVFISALVKAIEDGVYLGSDLQDARQTIASKGRFPWRLTA